MPESNIQHVRPRLRQLKRLHLYVHEASQHPDQERKNSLEWTLPLSSVKDLLELIGPGTGPRQAIIDGDEPLYDDVKACQLIAYLNLYEWTPFINTSGKFLKNKRYDAQLIARLSRAGLACIQFNLNGNLIEAVGIDVIGLLYREIRKNAMTAMLCYHLERTAESRLWLQRLLSQKDFNRIQSRIYILSFARRMITSALARGSAEGLPSELVMGHQGTLSLPEAYSLRPRRCSMRDPHWQQTVLQWFRDKRI